MASLCVCFDATCFQTDFLSSVGVGKVPAFSAWGQLEGMPEGGRVRKRQGSCLYSLSLLPGPCSHFNFVPFLCFGDTRGGSRGGGEGIQEVQIHGPFGIWSSWSSKEPTAEVGGRGAGRTSGPESLSVSQPPLPGTKVRSLDSYLSDKTQVQ